MIASEISKYENQRTKNKSTYWVLFELLWRDYFRSALCQQGFSKDCSKAVAGPCCKQQGPIPGVA